MARISQISQLLTNNQHINYINRKYKHTFIAKLYQTSYHESYIFLYMYDLVMLKQHIIA